MAEGLTVDLLIAAMWCGLFGFLVARRVLPLPLALSVVFAKVMIPVVYFAWFFDGTWTFLDDTAYLDQGREMLQLGYTPLTALAGMKGIRQMMSLSHGVHFLYGWWNLLAQYLFGVHYYSAILLNVVVTFICGLFSIHLLRELKFDEQYQRWFMLFFLLHWDVLAWSSFTNLKDVVVMMLTCASLLLLVKFFARPRLLTLVLCGLVLFIFSWIRFYLPFLILIVAGLWVFSQWHNRRKYFLIPVILVTFYLIFPWRSSELAFVQPAGFIGGILRFPLTPRFWNVEANYSFLSFPAIMHWMLFLPMFSAGFHLWRAYPLARLPLMYLAVFFAFYSVVPEVQDPRHRVQITFLLAWLQFHFLWTIVKGSAEYSVLPGSGREAGGGQ